MALCVLPVGAAQAATAKPRADLVVTSVANPPAAANPGTTFASGDTTRNRGRATAAASTTRYFLSKDAKVNKGDMRLAEHRVPKLRPRRGFSDRASLKVPTFTQAGTYRVIACADRGTKKLRESNERNNCRSAKRRVRITRTALLGPGAPGSDGSALTIAPGEQAFGAAVGLSHGPVKFTVTNSGKSASGTLATALAGTDAAMFAVSSDTCAGKTLAAGSSCTLNVTFSPTSLGAKSASLHVSGAPGGLAAATLTGTGQTAANLGISPASHGFTPTGVGSTSAGTVFTVTNNGEAVSGKLSSALSGLDSSQFKIATDNCAGITLAGAASCTVEVAFVPTGTGGKSASLEVSGTPGGTATAALTGTGLTPAVLSVTPTSHEFGAVSEGSSSGSQLFTVRNSGQETSGTLTTSVVGADSSQFVMSSNNCTGATLGENATCTLMVTFVPSGAQGPRQASLQITGAPGGTTSAALMGTANPPALTITPPNRDYGAIQVGSSSGFTFTVTNTGVVASGALSRTITGAHASQFAITGGTCTNAALAAGASCTITVTFAPTGAVGTRSAALEVAGGSAGTVTAPLSGTVVPGPAALAISPTTRDFGSVAVGSSSAPSSFTVTNTGGEASGTLTASTGGTHAAQFTISANTCTGTLAPGGTCTVSVIFTPSGTPTPGARSATLSVTGSPGGTATATLIGNATAGPAVLSINPTSREFGSVPSGQSSGAFGFTVTNTGQTTSSALAVTKTGTHAAQFVIASPNACANATLAPGASCTMSLTFAPTGTAGPRSATLQVTGTPQGGTVTSALTGSAL